jgi:EF-P beta-lysylation protein EpmB
MANMMSVEKTSLIPSWQQELQSAFTDIAELLCFLDLNADNLKEHYQVAKDFPLLVTRSYASRIKKSDWNDPLLRQVLPHPDELAKHASYLSDPVGDEQASVIPGLLHKYHGRVLVITTGACAIHCRYCFRREFPYSDNSAQRSQLNAIKQYLLDNPSVSEVILSGGDPLTLSDSRLHHLLESFADNPQIERIRIHTRLPIVLPSRITNTLLKTLISSNKKVIMVIHANHPNELNGDVFEVLQLLKGAGVTLLNQTVLLKGINDNAKTLTQLSHRLFNCNTLPYYLHLLDKVNGAMHFDSTNTHVHNVYEQLQKNLPGYLVPKLVREEQGKPYKTLIQTSS